MSRIDNFNVGSSPDPFVSNMAQRYSEQNGIHVPAHQKYGNFGSISITDQASRAIGEHYDRMPEFDKQAVPAFKQMAEETGRQYDFMTKPRSKGGMGIDVEVTKEDPYGFAGQKPKEDYSNWDANRIIGEVRHDVTENNRIKVYSTRSTGGHPILSDDQNDMFRAVHDVFGHLGSGRGIDHHGEEAAYQKHSAMFSPLARQAMATETRGQNSALRLHGSFQRQKVGFLPEHMQSAQFSRIGGAEALRQATLQARSKNLAQGI